jgi:hypothetical protein
VTPDRSLKTGIQPCYSGFQVQGTAGSPSSTTSTLRVRGYKIIVKVFWLITNNQETSTK